MWTETFKDKHALGVEMLNDTHGLKYSNEQTVEVTNEDGSVEKQYTYEVEEIDLAAYDKSIDEKKKKLIDAIVEQQRTIGTGKVKELAEEIAVLQNERDAIGKVVQTLEGNGTFEDPIKNWKVGMDVEKGKWYLVEDPNDPANPYLWEAVKSGTPKHELDKEFFDVVGV